jgi:predicted DNA binding protein
MWTQRRDHHAIVTFHPKQAFSGPPRRDWPTRPREDHAMSVIAGFTVSADEIVFGQALAGTETRIELTQFIPVEEQFVPYFWKERDGDTEVFEGTARDHPAVEDLVNLDGRVEAALYRIDWTEKANGFLDALREHDVLVEKATTNHGEEWSFRLRAFGQDELSAFQSKCHNNDIHIDVHRMVHNPTSGSHEGHDRALVNVTPKQHEAIELALERGYFHIPRESSATELAEEIDITRQAFSRRLQRAQQSVFTNLLTEFA